MRSISIKPCRPKEARPSHFDRGLLRRCAKETRGGAMSYRGVALPILRSMRPLVE